MNQAEYRPEINGIRGIACLIVLLGHSVACIFPAIYFGSSYKAHSFIEGLIHASPFNMFFNGSAMVMIFFIVSGYLIGIKPKKQNIVNFTVKRYIRYAPMMVVGVGLGAFVMWLGGVKHIELATFSFAGKYVEQYNNFIPSILGKDGVFFESFVKVFLVGSDYNCVLWYISVSFLGEIIFTLILNIVNTKKQKIITMSIIIVLLWGGGTKIWQLQYLSGVAIGIIISQMDIEIDNIRAGICFIVGIALLTFVDKSPTGIYSILSNVTECIVPIWTVGGAMVFIGTLYCDKIKRFLSNWIFEWLGRYSFEIYACQWPIIISVSCGCFLYLVNNEFNYIFAGWSSIFIGVFIIILVAVIVHEILYSPTELFLLKIYERISKNFK